MLKPEDLIGHSILKNTTQNQEKIERKREREREDWVPLAKEYDFTKEDDNLRDFLYESRDIAAKAASDLFSEVGVQSEDYKRIMNAPIGLDRKSYEPGAYNPGVYGILVGCGSEEIGEFLKNNRSEKLKNEFAATFVHEMVHMMLTDKGIFTTFDTVGNTEMGWGGLEEGMAEAIGQIAMKKQQKGWSLEETARDLEVHCAEHDAPLTQMSARLISAAKPDFLKWFLTCTQTGECHTNNKIKKAFDVDYKAFLDDMNILWQYEKGKLDLSKDKKEALVSQIAGIIDKNAEKLT